MKYASAGVRPSVSNRGRGGEGGAAAGRVCAQHEACGRTQPRRGRCMGTLAAWAPWRPPFTSVCTCTRRRPHTTAASRGRCVARQSIAVNVLFSAASAGRGIGGQGEVQAHWHTGITHQVLAAALSAAVLWQAAGVRRHRQSQSRRSEEEQLLLASWLSTPERSMRHARHARCFACSCLVGARSGQGPLCTGHTALPAATEFPGIATRGCRRQWRCLVTC